MNTTKLVIMKLSHFFIVLVLMVSYSCQKKNEIAPPLVDGKIDEYKKLGVKPITLPDNIHLFIYQNEHFVWVAYDYPENSYGTLDMEIQTNAIEKPINLHVSAQLGQWEIGNEEQRPKNGTSELWWEIEGWYANEVWANGVNRSKEPHRIKFKNAKAREVQLSKEHFGKGEWKIKLDIGAIADKEGKFHRVNFPEDKNEYYTLKVY